MGRGAALFFVLITLGAAWADEPDVTFVTEPGHPVEVRYKDGRVAELRVGRKRATHFVPKFKVAENTCTGRENIGGKLYFGFQEIKFELFWIKHPDAAKIGDAVKIRGKGSSGEPWKVSDVGSYLSNMSKKKMPKAAAEVPNDFFESDDFSWLPHGETGPPDTIVFSRWDSEAMLTNPETGLMENRTLGVGMGVTFSKMGPNRLELTGMKHFLGNPFSFFFGDIWAIVLKAGDEYCQISQKANLADVLTEAAQYLQEPPKQFVPYIFGSDELSEKSNFPILLSVYYSNPENYDVE